MVEIIYGTTVSEDRDDVVCVPDDGKNHCDFMLKFDDVKEKYFMSMETMYGFEKNGGCKRYVNQIFERFTDFLEYNKVNTKQSMNIEDTFKCSIDFSKKCDSIEECYAIFKLIVKGFNGDGLFVFG